MSRIFTSGFEAQSDSTTNRNESTEFWSNYRNSANTVCLINTTVKKTGTASLRCYSTSATARSLWAGLATSPTSGYVSLYLRVDTLPSTTTNIADLVADAASLYSPVALRLDSSGNLGAYYNTTSVTTWGQVGSSFSVTLGTWYHIEMYGKFNSATSVDAEWKVDGVSKGTVTAGATSGSTATTIGGIEIGLSIDDAVTTTGDWYFDDVIVNDTTGSYENSWVGDQFVIAMRPDAAGSVNTFLKTNLTTAGDTNNYTLVDETTPNDATDFVGSKTQNQEDFYTTSNSGLSTINIVKAVEVGYRHKGSGSGGGSFMGVALEAKIGAAGIVKSGATIVPTSNTEWKTNSNTAASYSATNLYRPYPIQMYLQPDDATAWTITALDDLNIGIKAINASSTKFATATAIWAMTSYVTKTCTVTGTATASINEADIVTGGKTIILTLANDTWVASGATFDAQRQNIINGIDSAQAEATGWDAVVKAGLAVTDVVRTSATVVTITLPAFATYNITANETITVTVPSTAVTGAVAITATPTFTVSYTPLSTAGFFGFM